MSKKICSWAGMLLLIALAGIARADIVDGEELSDPTRPIGMSDDAVAAVAAGPRVDFFAANYAVSFVRASSTSPVAIINDQRVSLGDKLGEAEVVAIDRSSVTLRIANQERRISIFDTQVRSVARETDNQ